MAKTYSYLLIYTLLEFVSTIYGQSSISNVIEDPQICTTKNGLWFTSKKSYFVGNFTKMNWFKANKHCKSLGMELLSIESEAEQELIRNILDDKKTEKEHFWASGSDLGQEGVWRWMGTGRALTYKSWSKGEPDNYGKNEHCMNLWTIGGESTKWTWNDHFCYNEFYFICEK